MGRWILTLLIILTAEAVVAVDCFPGETRLKEAKVVKDNECISGMALEVSHETRCAIAQDRSLKLVVGLSYQACGFLDFLGNEFVVTRARTLEKSPAP